MTDDTTRDRAVADTLADAAAEPEDITTTRAPRISAAALDDYVLGEVLGRGGMGEVVAAHDNRIEREVAIKRMRETHPEPSAIARFIREAKIQGRLDHPAIVPVHTLGTDEAGLPYFTMKRLVGTTLADKLQKPGPIQPLLRAFVDVCFAIELAHQRGVIHRDLKPSNIMFGDYNDVYVLDWGVARVLGTSRSSALHLPLDSLPPSDTATGAMLGTPGYMAPEQMRGDDVGAPADVYSLGAILFEILAGEPVHPIGSKAIASTLAGELGTPAKRRPDRAIAPELDAACAQALAEDAAARPTARALAERVQAYLDGDRDLEHRRRLAAEHIAAAREALATGKRADAIHRAGRALALEPESQEAAEIVTKLIVEPPVVLPPEIEREIFDAEREIDRERSRRGVWAYLMTWVFVVVVPLTRVQSWPLLALLLAIATALSGVSLYNARTGKLPFAILMGGNLVLVLVFSRVSGSFVLTPLLACGILLALSSHRQTAARPWLPIAWLLVAVTAPFALELAGVFAKTFQMVPEGLASHGTIFDGRSSNDLLAAFLGTVALVMVVGVYTVSVTRARRTAARETLVQAWHLRQLLPRR
jgi:serine/threonine-protein kinase